MSELASGFVEHLTQLHFDKFEVFSPVLPLFVRKRRQEVILSGRTRGIIHDGGSDMSQSHGKPAGVST